MNVRPHDSLAGPRYLRLPGLIGKTGKVPVGRSTLYSWIAQGRFPAPIKIGPRVSAWSALAVQAFLDQFDEKGYETDPPADKGLAELRFLRLPSLIGPNGKLPISKSTLYAWIRQGRFPAPIKLGPRVSAWSSTSVQACLDQFDGKGLPND